MADIIRFRPSEQSPQTPLPDLSQSDAALLREVDHLMKQSKRLEFRVITSGGESTPSATPDEYDQLTAAFSTLPSTQENSFQMDTPIICPAEVDKASGIIPFRRKAAPNTDSA